MNEIDIFKIINRKDKLFENDILEKSKELLEIISQSSFLVIGAGGSIGQAVTKEIALRNPRLLYCIDVSENSLVELVRDIRSSNYECKNLKTFNVDIGSKLFIDFFNLSPTFDYVLNLSALKHVRSEKDAFSLLRMIHTNIFYTRDSVELSINNDAKKYFCVSTDKAANPVNFMGASKRIMELYLSNYKNKINISSARFANVAFSNGSLLEGFQYRIQKNQPIAAPTDISRYFVSSKEAGELCLMSAIFGMSEEIFFPKLSKDKDMISMSDIAIRYLDFIGFKPHLCKSEDEARNIDINGLKSKSLWPCFFTESSTSGEKKFEEFFRDTEEINLNRFRDIGIIKNHKTAQIKQLNEFESFIKKLSPSKLNKKDLEYEFQALLSNFSHFETDLNLDDKM